MKGPPGILNSKGEAGSVSIYLKGSNRKALKEYGASTTPGTNTSNCFVLTGLDDVLSIHYDIEPGLVDFFDIVVDGILRESASPSNSDVPFKGAIKRVCGQGEIKKKPKYTTQRGVPKSYKLQVCRRNTDKDEFAIIPSKGLVDVGSIEAQFYQRSPSHQHSSASGLALRAPNFLQYGTWADKNHNVDIVQFSPVSFEIGLTDSNKLGKAVVDRVTKKWSSDYKLVGAVRFLLRSTTELQALGFAVPPYHVAPVTIPRMTSKSEVSYMKATESSTGGSSRISNTEHRDFDDDDEEDNSLLPIPNMSLRTSPSAINGKNSRPRSGTFSSNFEQEQVPSQAMARTENVELNSLNNPCSNALHGDPIIKVEPGLNMTVPATDKLVTSIYGLKGGPAYAAWDERDKATDELLRQHGLKKKQVCDIRQSSQPPRALELTDRTKPEIPVRHLSIEQDNSVSPISSFKPINLHSFNSHSHEFLRDKDLHIENSPTPTEAIDEEYINTLPLKSIFSQTTIDNTQLPFSQDEILLNISSPKLHTDTLAISRVIEDSQKIQNTPNISVHHPHATPVLRSRDEALEVAVSSVTPSGGRLDIPHTPRKKNKRKADDIDKSPSVIRVETISRKAVVSPAERNATEIMRSCQIAKKRLSVAQQKNEELRQQRETLLQIRRKKLQMQKDLAKAEELERQNAELQAQIDEMYDE